MTAKGRHTAVNNIEEVWRKLEISIHFNSENIDKAMLWAFAKHISLTIGKFFLPINDNDYY
jgi:hypothetical protein